MVSIRKRRHPWKSLVYVSFRRDFDKLKLSYCLSFIMVFSLFAVSCAV
jgi:hypothetical protein